MDSLRSWGIKFIHIKVRQFIAHVIKLPVKIRVFTEDKFQKAAAADAATIFLCEQEPHASTSHHVKYSTTHPKFNSLSTNMLLAIYRLKNKAELHW